MATCATCKGSGRVTCNSCGGIGSFAGVPLGMHGLLQACPTCEEKGKTACPVCMRKGQGQDREKATPDGRTGILVRGWTSDRVDHDHIFRRTRGLELEAELIL